MKWYIFFIVILFSFKSLGQKEVQVFFDFNEDFPNQNSILELNEWIAKNKDIEITKLLGFCDSIDSKEYNIQLATRRIESIQVLLSKSGLKFNENVEKTPFGKDFKQSKIQAENRKVIIYKVVNNQNIIVNNDAGLIEPNLGMVTLHSFRPNNTNQIKNIFIK